MTDIKRAPVGLSKKARELWNDTLETFDLDPHELPILEAACREIDLIALIEKKLKGASLISEGSMGQEVANPLLAEVRMHRAAYVSLMKALKLPDTDTGMTPRQLDAQKAANARWGRGA